MTSPRSFRSLACSFGLAALAALSLPSLGCAMAEDGAFDQFGEGNSLDPGVGQGGAQDFGLFREILLAGEIPGPDTIDDLGFFAEHRIELPDADCGENVCIHGMLGVMGNMISGSNCTVVLIGMNTPIDPEQLERPPLNLAITVDLSGSMAGTPMARLRDGLLAMTSELTAEDRITLIGFSDTAEVLVEQVPGTSPELTAAINGLQPLGGTNIYAGLREAYERIDAFAEDGRQNRVLLVSDGVANAGITSDAKILGLAESWSGLGYGLTTIGLGSEFDVELMRELAEVGSGSFYYVEDPAAVIEVFVEEAQAFLVPLAEQIEIEATVFHGYDLRNVYGTKQAITSGNYVDIEIPILQLAYRPPTEEPEPGRRGGGGAILLELLPNGLEPGEVGHIDFRYVDPVDGTPVEQSVDITSPLGPWETPEGGYFANPSVEKGFVMLNIFVGFRMAAARADVGDDPGALSVLRPLAESVEGWLTTHDDSDVEDDLFYINLFIENLEARGSTSHTPQPVPPEPWPAD